MSEVTQPLTTADDGQGKGRARRYAAWRAHRFERLRRLPDGVLTTARAHRFLADAAAFEIEQVERRMDEYFVGCAILAGASFLFSAIGLALLAWQVAAGGGS